VGVVPASRNKLRRVKGEGGSGRFKSIGSRPPGTAFDYRGPATAAGSGLALLLVHARSAKGLQRRNATNARRRPVSSAQAGPAV